MEYIYIVNRTENSKYIELKSQRVSLVLLVIFLLSVVNQGMAETFIMMAVMVVWALLTYRNYVTHFTAIEVFESGELVFVYPKDKRVKTTFLDLDKIKLNGNDLTIQAHSKYYHGNSEMDGFSRFIEDVRRINTNCRIKGC